MNPATGLVGYAGITSPGTAQGAGSLNTAGAIELATSINPTMPANSSWQVTGVPESTTIDGQNIVWGDLSLSQAFSASLSVLTTTK